MPNIASLSTEIYLLPTPSTTAFSSDPLSSLATTASGKHRGEESQAATVVISWKMAQKFSNFGYRNVRFKRSSGISYSYLAPCRVGGRVPSNPLQPLSEPLCASLRNAVWVELLALTMISLVTLHEENTNLFVRPFSINSQPHFFPFKSYFPGLWSSNIIIQLFLLGSLQSLLISGFL